MNTELQTQQDLITPRKIEVWRIRFEAFGQEDIAYADIWRHLKEVKHLISHIAPTAIITEICTDLVDQLEFERLNIANVDTWIKHIIEEDHE